ncbi:60S ribosomal protein L7A [Saguinus oedipus]|uniref:60S ribosomal protein L7a n=1 Tax=Saguinus oedipus TaxID=9490 RepID=A0ABQ9WHI5_SAGOE|nr:60S ribosomal protein L7A [Saguinus oedipus]
MLKGKKAKGKKVAAAPAVVKKQEAKKVVNALSEKRPENFGTGQDIQPKRDLTRFVKWPRNVRSQRQRGILCKLLRVPPAIYQFTQAYATYIENCFTAKQPLSYSARNSDQRQSKRSRGCGPGPRRKL